MRLLIVEDDDRTAHYLARGLTEAGHVVDHASDGETGLALASEGLYDVLVVDRRLPELDGITLIRRLRQQRIVTPALMLSAVAGTADRVEGMRAGYDDYVAKPYAFSEVLARLEALVRRTDRSLAQRMLRVGDLELDHETRRVLRAGQAITLQHREFILLAFLMRHAGQVVTRSMLLEAAWDYEFEPRGNIIDMHIHRLRQKIDRAFPYPLIHTVLGAGYRIASPGEEVAAPDASAEAGQDQTRS
ncbi:MAG: response regulator transcription factor [Acetobacteraceae bacterium]